MSRPRESKQETTEAAEAQRHGGKTKHGAGNGARRGSFEAALKLRTPISILRRAARRGHQGYPIATVAFYGPDDQRASKVVLGIVPYEGAEPQLGKWSSETEDLRRDVTALQSIVDRMRARGVRSVAMTDRIIGCPHEEGTDYPEGQPCPQCSFWRGRNRWTAEFEV